MTTLVELAGITGTLATSVLISVLVGRLALEILFRAITPGRRVYIPPGPVEPSPVREMK